MKRLFLPIFLFLLASLLRLFWMWSTNFDGLYGQDAFAYFNFAISLRESMIHLQFPEAFFWGLGYPILLMLNFSIFGMSATSGQMFSLLLGALLVPLVYCMARELKIGRVGAFLAALLMAICGQAIQSSIVLMSDIPALFFACLSAYALLRYWHEEKATWLVLAAGFLAWASISRWIYLLLAPLWTVSLLLHWRGRIRWRVSLIALGLVAAILIPQLIYGASTPYPTFSHEWLVRWSPLHAAQRDFVNADGIFHYHNANAIFYAAPFLNPYYLSPYFLVLILLGLVNFLKAKNSPQGLLIIGWSLLAYGYLVGIPYQNMRFALIYAPVCAILAGAGLDLVIGLRVHLLGRLLAFTCIVVIAAFGMFQTMSSSKDIIGTFIQVQNRDLEIANWAVEYIPEAAVLYTFSITQRMQLFETLQVYDLYFETPTSLDAKWQRGQADYILINAWEIENQWQGREPYIAFHWLYEHRGFRVMGRYGNYVLARVGE